MHIYFKHSHTFCTHVWVYFFLYLFLETKRSSCMLKRISSYIFQIILMIKLIMFFSSSKCPTFHTLDNKSKDASLLLMFCLCMYIMNIHFFIVDAWTTDITTTSVFSPIRKFAYKVFHLMQVEITDRYMVIHTDLSVEGWLVIVCFVFHIWS